MARWGLMGLALCLSGCDSGVATQPDGGSARDGATADGASTDAAMVVLDGCMAPSCNVAGLACGDHPDPCGGTYHCGGCPTGNVCTASGACVGTPARADNPFAGAAFYIDPEWSGAVTSAAARAPSELHDAVVRAASQPTAIWLDRIAAIDGASGSMGLAAHLDQALLQQAALSAGTPMTVVIVLYDLPNRDCSAMASNGELDLAADGMNRYHTEFIDHIVSVLGARPEYAALRVVAVLEPDAIGNAATNAASGPCAIAAPAYRDGLAYAIARLATIDYVYSYLDLAHAAWLGWDNAPAAATVVHDILTAAGGETLIRGFTVNVSNYDPVNEPFDPYTDMTRNMALIAGFYQYNQVIDETRYVASMRAQFPSHAFVIDTGRAGWPSRPAMQQRDRRTARANWCNVSGAGMGERAQADPAAGIDAYYWIKPPGASDGTSDSTQTTPDAEGKRFDPMCGQAGVDRGGGTFVATDALPSAPPSGHFFEAELFMLVLNATPAL